MKVKLLPLAIGAAIAMPGVALADGPTVYGKLNVSYEMVDIDPAYGDPAADNWQLISNASRLGVKGSEDINDSLSAIYKIEWAINADSGSDMGQRDRFVGLKGNFGTVKVGKFDSPLKKAQGKIDMLNDLSGDIGVYLLGEERLGNLLQYSSPSVGGVQFNFAWAPGEELDDGTAGNDPKDGPADLMSLSLTANLDGGLYVALAQDLDVATDTKLGIDDGAIGDLHDLIDSDDFLDFLGYSGAARFDTTRLVAVYKMDAFQLGALYQMSETSDDIDDLLAVEQDGYVLSGSFSVDKNVFKAQYGASTTEFSTDADSLESDATSFGLGFDHKLSKQTKLFAYYHMLSFELDEDGSEEQTKDNLGFGVEHKF